MSIKIIGTLSEGATGRITWSSNATDGLCGEGAALLAMRPDIAIGVFVLVCSTHIDETRILTQNARSVLVSLHDDMTAAREQGLIHASYLAAINPTKCSPPLIVTPETTYAAFLAALVARYRQAHPARVQPGECI